MSLKNIYIIYLFFIAAANLKVDMGLRATIQPGTSSSPCYLVTVAWNSRVTFPAGVVTPLRVNVTGCLLRYDSGAAGNGNGTVEVAGGGTELRLGSGLLQRGTEYAISLTMEGLYDGVQLSFTSGPVNVTCPDCSGKSVWV